MEKATFAAGCFWHVQKVFDQLDGVESTRVGYTGGEVPNPTYEQVCQGDTGHAEAIEVLFDPKKISYASLLDVFWTMHDPTTLNRQGPDIGRQYRSAIFTHSAAQREVAEHSMRDARGRFEAPIVTEITSVSNFYEAEAYHQKYFEKKGLA
ncbi:peptide-methionine (S)-S-oxide reductase MsrA [Simkania sp.]|uniref:peptide-methionine (S)-S-oxide reductase MsrA n=1 Tax=Simkania sp. TaxID=34094 RepID=UPI003B51D5FE